MGTFISILVIIVCVLLIAVILVQNSKGGGLASNFSSSNQIMGVKRTSDFLEKATWTLAISVLALSLFSAAFDGRKTEGASTVESELQELIDENAVTPPVGSVQDFEGETE